MHEHMPLNARVVKNERVRRLLARPAMPALPILLFMATENRPLYFTAVICLFRQHR